MNYRLLAEYSDIHACGQEYSKHQPLDDMLEEMRLGNYDELVMTSADRLSCDYAYYQRLIKEMREMGTGGLHQG